jgi:hypothetical protein
MPYLPEWSFVPERCKACRASRAAAWYDVSCQDCGVAIRAHRDWTNPPRRCQPCRTRAAAKWFDVRCRICGTTFKAHRDWSHVPEVCKSCRAAYPARTASCSHCGTSFTVKAGTRIKCRIEKWEEPKKCPQCRDLFKWQPFHTKREEGPLGVVYRTYNSRGQLVRESQKESTLLFGDRVRHSKRGKTHAFSYKREGLLGPHTEITDPKGKRLKRLDG